MISFLDRSPSRCHAAANLYVAIHMHRDQLPAISNSFLVSADNAHVSIHTVDIGLAQLAMHSCYETAGIEDEDHLIRAMTVFYSAAFREENKKFTLS